MEDKGLTDFFRKLDRVEQMYRNMPRVAGVIAVNFVKARFREQNWVDNATEPWAKRKLNPGGRATLTGKGSGALRRSYRITRSGVGFVAIGTDKAYAQIHNEGGKIAITPKMRGFFFFKAKELKEAGRIKESQYYINLATTKKTHLRIPRRKHIGESAVLTRLIDRQMLADLNRVLNN